MSLGVSKQGRVLCFSDAYGMGYVIDAEGQVGFICLESFASNADRMLAVGDWVTYVDIPWPTEPHYVPAGTQEAHYADATLEAQTVLGRTRQHLVASGSMSPLDETDVTVPAVPVTYLTGPLDEGAVRRVPAGHLLVVANQDVPADCVTWVRLSDTVGVVFHQCAFPLGLKAVSAEKTGCDLSFLSFIECTFHGRFSLKGLAVRDAIIMSGCDLSA
ncbi:MAG: hypothetical protein WED11_12645, partial [Natronospirillum sp.]